MKPKLAHVDISSKSGTQMSSESSDYSEGSRVPKLPVTREKGNIVERPLTN